MDIRRNLQVTTRGRNDPERLEITKHATVNPVKLPKILLVKGARAMLPIP